MTKCNTESHELAKTTARWLELEPIGVMDIGDGERLELRNCPDCRSTLCKPVEAKGGAS
jgi:hypothetical protein